MKYSSLNTGYTNIWRRLFGKLAISIFKNSPLDTLKSLNIKYVHYRTDDYTSGDYHRDQDNF